METFGLLALNAFAAAELGDEVRARMRQVAVAGELVSAVITDAPCVPRAPTTATRGLEFLLEASMAMCELAVSLLHDAQQCQVDFKYKMRLRPHL